MGSACPGCGGSREVGALCRACVARVAPCEGLLPDHVLARTARDAAAAWLFDGFGRSHPVSGPRTVVGRADDGDLIIHNVSVSRRHAELGLVDGGWQVRDLGSRNGSHVDGRRVQGRAALGEAAALRFGDVGLLFSARPHAAPVDDHPSVATEYAAALGTQRFTLRGPSLNLCLLASDGDPPSGGALLYRGGDGDAWSEMSLPPLEFQLLRTLCVRAVAEATSPARSRGCVPTKQLARELPFQSRFANEENVRQVVRRIRTTLHEIGAQGLVEALPGRGYYVTWTVVAT